MSNPRLSPNETDLFHDWQDAKKAEARWKALKEDAAAELYLLAGIKPDDQDPKPVTVEGDDGEPLYSVEIGHPLTLSQKLVAENYPEVAAACKVRGLRKSIKEA